MREGVSAGQRFQELARELSEMNRQAHWTEHRRRRQRPRPRAESRAAIVVQRRYEQHGLFECLLPDREKLWWPELRRIDELLEDDGIIVIGIRGPGRG